MHQMDLIETTVEEQHSVVRQDLCYFRKSMCLGQYKDTDDNLRITIRPNDELTLRKSCPLDTLMRHGFFSIMSNFH